MSSTHTYRAPLLRRILPWIYVVVFFVTAPLLVFYTAGYRYNFKKGAIERNGTLIVDSIPTGATVVVDGKETGQKTPVTFQQMTPGWHTVFVTKPGYGSWQQDILVRAERVAFTNHIRLWRQGDPTLVSSGPYIRLENAPDKERLLAFQATDTGVSAGWWSPTQSATVATIPITSSSIRTMPLRWRTNGEAVLLGGTATIPNSWLLTSARAQTNIETLPDGRYHWSGNDLIGVNEKVTLTIDGRSGAIERETLDRETIERSDSITLRTSPSSTHLLLSDESFLGKLFSLPAGSWSIHEWVRPYLFLSDGSRWLGIRLRLGVLPNLLRVEGDRPRWSPDTKNPRAAFITDYEVILWTPESPARVVWRQSTPIRDAVWNTDGEVLYVADAQTIFALTLDTTQDPRPIPLAVFDEVFDVAVQEDTIFAVGTRGDVRGIFRLPGM